MSLKKHLLKTVMKNPKLPAKYASFQDVEYGTIVHGIQIRDDYEAIFHGDVELNMTLNHMLITRPRQINDHPNNDSVITPDGILLNIFKKDDETIAIGFMVKTVGKREMYMLASCYELKPKLNSFENVWRLKEWSNYIEDEKRRLLPELLIILETMRNFERVVRTDPTKSYSISKLSPKLKETYVEWEMDMTKPITRVKNRKGGTHESPREHERIGHWRVSKLGKRYFVKPTIVCAGSVKGKVEKVYKVS